MMKQKTMNGALLRGLLVVAIAMLTAMIAGVTAHTAPLILTLTATLQGLIALRGYIDQSLSEVTPESPVPADKTAPQVGAAGQAEGQGGGAAGAEDNT